MLAIAGKHREAVAVLEQGWQLLPEDGGYLQSLPAAVWLAESYRHDKASGRWWQEACRRAGQLMDFDPVAASYWQGRALAGLGDVKSAIAAYQSAWDGQLLYPLRAEVKRELKRLQTLLRKGSPS